MVAAFQREPPLFSRSPNLASSAKQRSLVEQRDLHRPDQTPGRSVEQTRARKADVSINVSVVLTRFIIKVMIWVRRPFHTLRSIAPYSLAARNARFCCGFFAICGEFSVFVVVFCTKLARNSFARSFAVTFAGINETFQPYSRESKRVLAECAL